MSKAVWGGGGGCFFFQAEDGIRYLVRSRGLGDVYKRQGKAYLYTRSTFEVDTEFLKSGEIGKDLDEFKKALELSKNELLSLIHI